MRVKHGAVIKETLSTKDGRILETKLTPIDEFSAQMNTLWSMMYNAAGVSGGVRWQHPTTGELYPNGLSYAVGTENPSDTLGPGQFCDCGTCGS